jgi:hypothetical protein
MRGMEGFGCEREQPGTTESREGSEGGTSVREGAKEGAANEREGEDKMRCS